MIFIFLGILIASVSSYSRLLLEELETTREFHRLTKVVSSSDPIFNRDFLSEVSRYNFSESAYSGTCAEAYIAMRFTPWELSALNFELADIREFMNNKNITDPNPEVFKYHGPVTWLIITSRLEALDRLSGKALPETREFIQSIRNELISDYFKFLTHSEYVFEKIANTTTTKIAKRYKTLTNGIKRDLERSFCVRNTLRWTNTDLHGTFDKYFHLFSEEVGLNIDELLKISEYLSSFPVKEVKEKFKRRAEKYNLPAQEYVDTCSKTLTILLKSGLLNAMNESDGVAHMMGEHWAQRRYTTTEELKQGLYNDSAPVMSIVYDRWNLVKSSVTGTFHVKVMDIVEDFLLKSFLHENRSLPRRFSPNFYEVFYQLYMSRDVEQGICVQSAAESITKYWLVDIEK